MHNLLIIFSVLLSSITISQEKNIETILKGYFKQLSIIECQYYQEKELSMITRPLISSGIFKYEKDGDIIWSQKEPFDEVYLISEKSNNKIDKYINRFIISIITGDILNDQALATNYSESNKEYTISLIPKKGAMREKIKEIILIFNKEKISLNKLEVHSQNGDLTKINFYEN